MKPPSFFIIVFLASILPINSLLSMDLSSLDSSSDSSSAEAQPPQPQTSGPSTLRLVGALWVDVDSGLPANPSSANDPHYDPTTSSASKRRLVEPEASSATSPHDNLDDFNTYLSWEELINFRTFSRRGLDSNQFHRNHAAHIPPDKLLALKQNFTTTYPDEVLAIASDFTKRYIQKIVLPKNARIIFFGDLHGDIQAFVRMLCKLMAEGELSASLSIKKPNTYMFFLGDIVDYGFYSIEALATVMQLKITNPSKVFICRGNHEDYGMNMENGFCNEIKFRYPSLRRKKIISAFNFLPAAIFVGIQEDPAAQFIQCCHGGIDKQAHAAIDTLLKKDGNNIIQELDGPNPALNFQWGDFTGIGGDAPLTTERGPGVYQYPIPAARNEMRSLSIKYIFRGHQDSEYALKHLVATFKEPIGLFPTPSDRNLLSALTDFYRINPTFRAWHSDKVKSLSHLQNTGIILGELPPEVGPVFTFTNASFVRINYDEGFGLLEVNDIWDNSTLKFFTNRPSAFEDGRQNRNAFSPHYTVIDKDGESEISTDATKKGISPEFMKKIREAK